MPPVHSCLRHHVSSTRTAPYSIPVTAPLIPGVPLSTQLPEPNYADPRGSVRLLLTKLLVLATGDLCARMWWNLRKFHKEVALRYGFLLYGWPPDIPFGSLSTGKGNPTLAQVNELLVLLTAKPQPCMFFVRATPEQLHALHLDVTAAAPGPLFPTPIPLPYVGRSDIGRRRTRHTSEGSVITPRYARDGPKSAKVIEEEPVSEVSSQVAVDRPLPQMYKNGVWMVWNEPTGTWRVPSTSELMGSSNIGWNCTHY